jgi:hypothetical protein
MRKLMGCRTAESWPDVTTETLSDVIKNVMTALSVVTSAPWPDAQ